MTLKFFFNLIMLLTLTTTLASCGISPEEKEQRRANAFDLSGTYQIGSGTTMQIVNEGDRSNVYAIIDRGGFTRGEEQAFARQGISLNMVEKFRTRFEIGKGKHLTYFQGGENISTDFGKSSKVSLYTNTNEDLSVDNYSINYSIYATMDKASATLKGTLTMSISKTTTTNGQTNIESVERYDIPFSSK